VVAGLSNVVCSLYASPSGSGGNGGTQSSPYDLQTLINKLSPGGTGCLLSGHYGAAPDPTGQTARTGTWWQLNQSGTSAAPITLTEAPGDATVPIVEGYLDVEGDYWTVSHLNIDTANTWATWAQSHPCPSTTPPNVSEAVTLMGTGDTLDHDYVYNSQPKLYSVTVGIGWWGSGSNAVIRYSEILQAGQCWQYDHAIYLAGGSGAQIHDNWIWSAPGNAGGQAVSIYPNPTNAHIYRNVIDGTNSGFDIGGSAANNTLDHNIVSNAGYVYYLGGTSGFDGVFMNCIASGTGNTSNYSDSYNSADGATPGCTIAGQMAWSNTSTADPQYLDPTNHDYGLEAASPFASWGLPTASQVGPLGS